MQEAKGEESADNGGTLVGGPEEAEADGELLGFVEVGQEEDGVGDAAKVRAANQNRTYQDLQSTLQKAEECTTGEIAPSVL